MKKELGVTLISLIMYVILMTFIIALISNITASFYVSVTDFDNDSESAVAYAKFNMYFINDIKREGAAIYKYDKNYIVLSYTETTITDSGNGETITRTETTYVEYSVQNNILYRDKVKICENVNDILIEVDTGKNTIKVDMIIGDYEKITTYVVENMSGITSDSSGHII